MTSFLFTGSYAYTAASPDVKIIKSWLLESRWWIRARFDAQVELFPWLFSLSAEAARNALLENLQHRGRCFPQWFPDKQAYRLGHHDILGQNKPTSISHLDQNVDEGVSGGWPSA